MVLCSYLVALTLLSKIAIHRHLVEMVRTLLLASQVPHLYWVEAFSTAIYLINRLSIGGLLKSPWELLFHTYPNCLRLTCLVVVAFPGLNPIPHQNWRVKANIVFFLGYSLQHKGYRCIDHIAQRIYISRKVVFDENQFPFHTTSSALVPEPKSQHCKS